MEKQLELFEDDQPRFDLDHWDVFTLDHDEDQAAHRFQKRFGHPPKFCQEHNKQLWLGPVKGIAR